MVLGQIIAASQDPDRADLNTFFENIHTRVDTIISSTTEQFYGTPAASDASDADNADNADNAVNAVNAGNAGNAGNAVNAVNAVNADNDVSESSSDSLDSPGRLRFATTSDRENMSD